MTGPKADSGDAEYPHAAAECAEHLHAGANAPYGPKFSEGAKLLWRTCISKPCGYKTSNRHHMIMGSEPSSSTTTDKAISQIPGDIYQMYLAEEFHNVHASQSPAIIAGMAYRKQHLTQTVMPFSRHVEVSGQGMLTWIRAGDACIQGPTAPSDPHELSPLPLPAEGWQGAALRVP